MKIDIISDRIDGNTYSYNTNEQSLLHFLLVECNANLEWDGADRVHVE